jgi:hypothetical protein
MNSNEIEMLKVVIFDYANTSTGKKSRWDCLQFASRSIEGRSVPKEIIEYINQLNYQTNLIKS